MKIKNACKECFYYVEANNTCQSKKCACVDPHVSLFDKLFCEPYKPNLKNLDRSEEE